MKTHVRLYPALLGLSACLGGADLGVDLPLVGSSFTLIGGSVAFVGSSVPFVGGSVAFVGSSVPFVGGTVPFVGYGIGAPFAGCISSFPPV